MSGPPLKSFGNWTEQKSSSGKIYFYNKQTEISQWEKPQEWKENDAKMEQEKILSEKHKYQSTPIPPPTPMLHPPPPIGFVSMNMPPPPPHFLPFAPGASPAGPPHFQPPSYPGQYYAGPPGSAQQMYHPPPPPKAFPAVPPPPIVPRSSAIPPPPPPSSSSSQHINSHEMFSSPSGSVVPPPPPPTDQAMHNSYVQSRREYDYTVSPSTSHGKSNGSTSIPSTPGDGPQGSIYKRELANLKNGQQSQHHQHHNNNSGKRQTSPSHNSSAPVRKKMNNGSTQDDHHKHKHNQQTENNESSTMNWEKKDDEFSEMVKKYYDPVLANEKAKDLGLMDDEGRSELQRITRESLILETTITSEHVASVGARCLVVAEVYAKRILEEQLTFNEKILQQLDERIQDTVPDFTNAMQLIAGKELLLHDT